MRLPAWSERRTAWAVVAAFCIVVTVQVAWATRQHSATFDEPINLVSGYLSLRFGNDRLGPHALPLSKLIAALPVAVGYDLALPDPPKPTDTTAQYGYAYRALYGLNDADRLLTLARLTMLAFPLVLGVVVFWWTHELAGLSAATTALVLLAFDPNILAHSGLVTSDLATTCLIFVTVHAWYRLHLGVTWPRVLVAGLGSGLAVLAKATAFVILPATLVIAVVLAARGHVPQLQFGRWPGQPVRSRVGGLVVMLTVAIVSWVIAYGVIWCAYRFRFESATAPVATYLTSWQAALPPSAALRSLVELTRRWTLLPDAYLYGLTTNVKTTGRFAAYLLGDIRAGGWWYYFIVAFLVKTTVPVLLLLALAGWRGRAGRARPAAALFLVTPVVLYFVAISASRWNVGHRHLLPIYPFLFVLIAVAAASVLQHGRWARLTVGALLAWHVGTSIWIAPHYLAYFNELVGGPDRGPAYLLDSNLDWGQDLKGLRTYMDEHQLPWVWLGYFGQASPRFYGIRAAMLPSYVVFDPEFVPDWLGGADRAPPLPGTVAISANLLHGLFFAPERRDFFAAYRDRTPDAKIGYSIFVYRNGP